MITVHRSGPSDGRGNVSTDLRRQSHGSEREQMNGGTWDHDAQHHRLSPCDIDDTERVGGRLGAQWHWPWQWSSA